MVDYLASAETYKNKYKQNISDAQDVLNSPGFRVSDNIRSEYDMWVWVFQEIANLRMEVSRLGVYVRINNSNSPSYLKPYHAHILSFLLPVSVVIDWTTWSKVESLYNKLQKNIDDYFTIRKNIPNKKIPDKLIKELDALYRVGLLATQKAGLGFKVNSKLDFEKAIEKAVTIS